MLLSWVRDLGSSFVWLFHLPGVCPPSRSAGGWEKASLENWGRGGLYANITAFPVSLTGTQPHRLLWGRCEMYSAVRPEGKLGRGNVDNTLNASWMLHQEGDSLLSSLPGLEISLLVCWMKHLERWVCVYFSVRDYVLLIVTKTYLEWLTQKGSLYFLSLHKKGREAVQNWGWGCCLEPSVPKVFPAPFSVVLYLFFTLVVHRWLVFLQTFCLCSNKMKDEEQIKISGVPFSKRPLPVEFVHSSLAITVSTYGK